MYLSRTLDAVNQTTAAVCVFLSRTCELSWHLDSNSMVLFLSKGTLTWEKNSFPGAGRCRKGTSGAAFDSVLGRLGEKVQPRAERNLHPPTDVPQKAGN